MQFGFIVAHSAALRATSFAKGGSKLGIIYRAGVLGRSPQKPEVPNIYKLRGSDIAARKNLIVQFTFKIHIGTELKAGVWGRSTQEPEVSNRNQLIGTIISTTKPKTPEMPAKVDFLVKMKKQTAVWTITLSKGLS